MLIGFSLIVVICAKETVLFENLTGRLEEIFKRLRSRGRLSEKDVEEALRDIRIALLEADVNFKVVKSFIEKVKEQAVGEEVLRSLTPGQQVVKIVHSALTELLGGLNSSINFSKSAPTVVMLVGLQGSGKTTTAAKLALKFKQAGKKPLLVAADVKRPAAVEQLRQLAEKIGVPTLERVGADASGVCKGSIGAANETGCDLIIVDTAGRLHIDEELMAELRKIKGEIKPAEILLVADAMAGQDAVNVARAFDEKLGIDGAILTKLDGDARAGAALSFRDVTGKPIKFVGVGEKLDKLEHFYPDRMASRILGMGDVLSLVEKVEQTISQERAKELEAKLRREAFTLDDFKDQLLQLKKMGPMEQILAMIPGLNKMQGLKMDGREFVKMEAIINSMTARERQDHTIIGGSRRRRIALGSGTSVQDVNRLLKQFAQMRKLLKTFSGKGGKRGLKFGWGRFPV